MNADREFFNRGTLSTNIIDLNLGIGDTTTETRLDVRLVLTVTIANDGLTTKKREEKGIEEEF